MNTTERIKLVNEVLQCRHDMDDAWEPLIKAVRNHDFPAYEQSNKAFELMVNAVAKLIDDKSGWLMWFIFDNKCGQASMEAKAASWPKRRPIRTDEDLVSIIEADLPADPLDDLESMARQNCHTRKVDRDYNGQVAGTLVTDSGAISAHAEALLTLANAGRFRVVAAGGRMVVGYWPENDPEKKNPKA